MDWIPLVSVLLIVLSIVGVSAYQAAYDRAILEQNEEELDYIVFSASALFWPITIVVLILVLIGFSFHLMGRRLGHGLADGRRRRHEARLRARDAALEVEALLNHDVGL